MNVLFLTTGRMVSIEQRSLYPDLLRQFRDHGHQVYCVSALEKRNRKDTEYITENGAHLLRVRIGNLTKTNVIEKGISTLTIEWLFLAAIKKYMIGVKFDLILYSTPPITLSATISYIKNRDHARTYLLLKDIFPQNAVDIGMMKTKGISSILYHYFRNKEKKLYALSDFIGCMSQANVRYVLEHNPEITKERVEECPNSIEVQDMRISNEERGAMREKYHIPQNKIVLVYGGNLGKPQAIPFIIECMEKCKGKEIFFLIVGDGTEFDKLQAYINEKKPSHVKLMKRLPKDDYEKMVGACDVGMIFLDHRFTIPNFPSRLLGYIQAGLPVLASTDSNTDIGHIIEAGDFGWWCESNSSQAFAEIVDKIISKSDLESMREAAWKYLMDHYQVNKAYETIINRL